MALGAPIVLLALMAVAKPPSGPGDPIPIRVEFDAPAGCSDVESFYAGVLSRSDRARRAAPGDEAVRMSIKVVRAGGKVHGELRFLDGRADTETRKVDGIRCDEVVEVLSLTAALAIDPAARIAPGRPPPPVVAGTTGAGTAGAGTGGASAGGGPGAAATPATASPASPSPPPEPPAARTPEPPPTVGDRHETHGRRRFTFAVGVEALAAQVLSPGVSFGGAIAARLGRAGSDGAGPSIQLAAFRLSNDLVQSAPDIVATFTGASAVVCPGWRVGASITLEACAAGAAGWLAVTGRAVTNPMSKGRSWGTLGPLLRAATALGAGFSLELDAGLGISLVERRFITTTPERIVGETPTLSAMVGVAIARTM